MSYNITFEFLSCSGEVLFSNRDVPAMGRASRKEQADYLLSEMLHRFKQSLAYKKPSEAWIQVGPSGRTYTYEEDEIESLPNPV